MGGSGKKGKQNWFFASVFLICVVAAGVALSYKNNAEFREWVCKKFHYGCVDPHPQPGGPPGST
jgi:hypothetical protein